MNNNNDIKAVVGNIPIKEEKKKKKESKKKVNSDYRYPLWVRILVWVMTLMMFMSFAGSLIIYFISAIKG